MLRKVALFGRGSRVAIIHLALNPGGPDADPEAVSRALQTSYSGSTAESYLSSEFECLLRRLDQVEAIATLSNPIHPTAV
jgi:hypothetical protein